MAIYFNSPFGVANDGEFVYVTDSANHRVQKFTLNGVYVSQWGSFGSEPGQFNTPKGIAVNNRFVFVVDQANHRFQVFDKFGYLVMVFGEYGLGDSLDVFNFPTHTYVDPYYLYIDDTGNGLIKWYEINIVGTYGTGEIPAITSDAIASDAAGGEGEGILPIFEFESPEATASTGASGQGNGEFPAFDLFAPGSSDGKISGDGELPYFRCISVGSSGAGCSGDGILPTLEVIAKCFAGPGMFGRAILPPLIVSASGRTMRRAA